MSSDKPLEVSDGKQIVLVGGDGDTYARGLVDQEVVLQTHHCFMCRSFDVTPLEKMLQHLLSKGCKQLPDGTVESPRPNEAGKGLVIDPRSFGWCRRDSIATDMQGTCPDWQQKATRRDFGALPRR